MRGFAQTVHCPRCGTPKAMGVEVVPIVSCAKCGLGYDPKPREPQPRAELVAPATSLVHEEVTETEARLIVRDSLSTGVYLALASGLLGYVAYLGIGAGTWLAIPAAIAAVVGVYGGISRIVGSTVVDVSRDIIVATQRPLPRQRQCWIGGDAWSLAVVPRDTPAGRSHDVVATQVGSARAQIRLASFAHEAEATELVDAIRRHRVRLGAPVLDE